MRLTPILALCAALTSAAPVLAADDSATAAQEQQEAQQQALQQALQQAGAALTTGAADKAGSALRLIEPEARAGTPLAQYFLGLAYDRGLGKQPEPRLARDWLSKAAAQGLPEAQYQLGLMLLEGRETLPPAPAEAREQFDLAMKQGHSGAFFMRAVMMRDGLGLAEGSAKDPAGAAALFGVALEMGAPQAGVALGDLYRRGEGVTRDAPRARALFSRAGAMGYGPALGNLALMLELGEGGAKNPAAAHALYLEAVRLGDSNAAVNLAWFMMEHEGYWQDPALALAYCLWAMRSADPASAAAHETTCAQIQTRLSADQIAQAESLSAEF